MSTDPQFVLYRSTEDLRTTVGDLEAVEGGKLSIADLEALELKALRDVVDVAKDMTKDLEHITGGQAFFLGVTLGRLDDIQTALRKAGDPLPAKE